ncbi:NH(3)-dependent NAD(+) synthetase [Marinithermofilum abyssi]|uniref:NH(3)-dependent NAD(+) synthetase n=1 Tax=Marinithermofilum abyssi TaxID=1571185 RepID=A0A8J2VFC1_9BACL|nr:NAD+ synthase [Marinithermofilum abyssi]GGE18852.1 NH(3)-dependent NAD(+) synthetase [Marinithermofilum abyssi]
MTAVHEMLEKAPYLRVDEEVIVRLLTTALKEEVEKAGIEHVVIGLSGGLDSALALYLCVEAFGKDRVLAVRMPYKTSSASSLEDAQAAIDDTGVESLTVEITPQVDAYFERFPDASPLRRGNKMARERMSILYDLSAARRALVIGTSNKSELLLGYGTQFGDLGSAVNPLGDLYKTQVRQLAAYMKVPESIIAKPPSADLWEDQTDEKELGFTYFDVDRLLYFLVDQRYDRDKCIAQGFDPEFVDGVARRIQINQYKRRTPVILKTSSRTVGIDFRYLRDWGL